MENKTVRKQSRQGSRITRAPAEQLEKTKKVRKKKISRIILIRRAVIRLSIFFICVAMVVLGMIRLVNMFPDKVATIRNLTDTEDTLPSHYNKISENGRVVYDTKSETILVEKSLLRSEQTRETDDDTGYEYTLALDTKESGQGKLPVNSKQMKSISLDGNEIRVSCQSMTAFITDFAFSEKYLSVKPVPPKEKYEKILLIDPGHGGNDPGAEQGTVFESEINLKISLYLLELFQKDNSGIKAYITRTDDSSVSLSDRVEMANNIADFFVSIHNNVYEDSAQIHGTQTHYKTISKEAGAFSSKELAAAVQKKLVDELDSKDREILFDDELFLLKNATVPAILTEVGYMTNPEEFRKLMQEDYQRTAARAIYDGILEVAQGKSFPRK